MPNPTPREAADQLDGAHFMTPLHQVRELVTTLQQHARDTAEDDDRGRELARRLLSRIDHRAYPGGGGFPLDFVLVAPAERMTPDELLDRLRNPAVAPVENESERRVRLGIGDGLDHAVAGDGGRRRRVDMRDPDGSEDSWSDTPADLVESAFGLICNVDGPAQGWTQNEEWVRAADRWCARYDRVIAAASSSETAAIERLLVGELSVAFEAGRNWVPGGAAWDTQHHARQLAARLAATSPPPGGEDQGTSAVAAKVVEFAGGPLHDAERRVPITSGALPAAVVAPDADGRLTIYVLAYDDGEQPFYDYAGEPQGNEITRSARVLDDRSPAPAFAPNTKSRPERREPLPLEPDVVEPQAGNAGEVVPVDPDALCNCGHPMYEHALDVEGRCRSWLTPSANTPPARCACEAFDYEHDASDQTARGGETRG